MYVYLVPSVEPSNGYVITDYIAEQTREFKNGAAGLNALDSFIQAYNLAKKAGFESFLSECHHEIFTLPMGFKSPSCFYYFAEYEAPKGFLVSPKKIEGLGEALAHDDG